MKTPLRYNAHSRGASTTAIAPIECFWISHAAVVVAVEGAIADANAHLNNNNAILLIQLLHLKIDIDAVMDAKCKRA